MQKLTPETFAKLHIATERLDELATLDDRVFYVLRELEVYKDANATTVQELTQMSEKLEQILEAKNAN